MTNERDLTYTKDQTYTNWMLIIGVMMIATTLRVPLTSVGPLIPFIREDLMINNTVAGFITTLPLLAFALFSPFAPKIANKMGMEMTIAISIFILLIGMSLRSFSTITTLLFGTLLIGLAIAVGNVLIPAIIKVNFPLRVGLMTGFYAVFMNVFGALGSGLSVPLSEVSFLNWQGALLLWAILVFLAFLLWLPQVRNRRKTAGLKAERSPKINLYRSPVAWAVTIFMGGQSLAFYTAITWLPEMLSTLGYGAAASGWLVFLLQLSLIPTTFIVPMFAERMENQTMLALATGIIFILGFLLLFLPVKWLAPITVLILGVACGAAFSLSMMFFSLRTNNGMEAAELSGMAQSFGYLLAATGPVFVGLLYDLGNSWTLPLLFLIIISAIVLMAGIFAGKKRTV